MNCLMLNKDHYEHSIIHKITWNSLSQFEIIPGIGVIMEVFEADIGAGHLGNLNKVYQDPLLLLRPFQLWWHLNYIL